MPMRGEVGLLSRNIRISGDRKSSLRSSYGATFHTLLDGNDSAVTRISGVQFALMGKAYKTG